MKDLEVKHSAPEIELPSLQEIPSIEHKPGESFLTIIAVGDNLYHITMIRDGENGDYLSAYTEIKPLAERADIAFINQETILAGEDFGFSGYPQFNSPQAMGRAIAASGFNLVNHATNHTMDKGEEAIFRTLDFWDTIPGMNVLGIHRSEENRKAPFLIEKNNIKTGFLSYTYGTNNHPLPPDKPYLVSLIDRKKMAEEIDSLRPHCDLLVVSMHWGEEYRHDYSKRQEELAVFLAEHQADIVIGHHPHVVQRVEYIPRPDGRQMLCFYSLGNFLSGQTQNAALLGAMAFVIIKKSYNMDGIINDIIIEKYGALPLVTHYENNFTNIKVYPLYAYTEELIKKHLRNAVRPELTMDYLKDLSSKIFGDKELRENPFGMFMPWLFQNR